jgi:hypothetical protein
MTDPIYRESALALEAMSGEELLSWMADLMTIRTLSETTEDRLR